MEKKRKEIEEDLRKWRDLLCSWIGRINIVKIYHWKERPIGHTNFICPSTGERQGQKNRNGWVGKSGGGYGGLLG